MTVEKDSIFARILDAFNAKTATEVADKLGFSPQAVSKWNQDGGMKFSTLISISTQTGVSIHWLLTGQGGKYPGESVTGKTAFAGPVEGDWTLFSALVDGRLLVRLRRGDVEVSYTVASMTHDFTK